MNRNRSFSLSLYLSNINDKTIFTPYMHIATTPAHSQAQAPVTWGPPDCLSTSYDRQQMGTLGTYNHQAANARTICGWYHLSPDSSTFGRAKALHCVVLPLVEAQQGDSEPAAAFQLSSTYPGRTPHSPGRVCCLKGQRPSRVAADTACKLFPEEPHRT